MPKESPILHEIRESQDGKCIVTMPNGSKLTVIKMDDQLRATLEFAPGTDDLERMEIQHATKSVETLLAYFDKNDNNFAVSIGKIEGGETKVSCRISENGGSTTKAIPWGKFLEFIKTEGVDSSYPTTDA